MITRFPVLSASVISVVEEGKGRVLEEERKLRSNM